MGEGRGRRGMRCGGLEGCGVRRGGVERSGRPRMVGGCVVWDWVWGWEVVISFGVHRHSVDYVILLNKNIFIYCMTLWPSG